MIQIAPQTEIGLALEAVDFRRGIDGLTPVCRELLRSDPFSGALFVFRDKRGTATKISTYNSECQYLSLTVNAIPFTRVRSIGSTPSIT